MKTLITIAMILFATAAYADPPWVSQTVRVNGNTGSDTLGDGSAQNPYQTIAKALDVIGDDSHARIIWAGRSDKNINDTPTVEEALRYIRIMQDRSTREYKAEIIEGAEPCIVEEVDTSSVAGIGYTIRYEWKTFYNNTGLNRYCSAIEEAVVPEDYNPVP